jgi:hypothetical protein
MAQTQDKFRDAVALLQQIADKIDEVRGLGRTLIDIHNGEDFSGAGNTNPVPGWVQKSADGNLKGFHFTADEYLSGVQFVMQLEKLMTNQAPGTGFWNSIIAHLLTPTRR